MTPTLPTSITLYDLAGAEDDRRFSPNCWRTRLCLLHKGLPFETIPWRFVEKEAIAFSGQGKVPVLVDGSQTVIDSWGIAEYLEATYPSPDYPSLFGGEAGKGLCQFMTQWVGTALNPILVPLIIVDIYQHLHEKDREYFRRTREQALGKPLEELCTDPEQHLQQLHKAMTPLRRTLQVQSYLAGSEPNWADYVVFSAFQWARSISQLSLIPAEDPIFAWRERLLDAFNGEARRSLGYPCC